MRQNAGVGGTSEAEQESSIRSPGPDRGALRLADLLASLSLVADLGFGLPPESSMRSCLVATALARRIGLTEPEVADVYYTTLLEHLGCTGYAHEAAERYGDELVMNMAAANTNLGDPRELFTTYLPSITGRRPLPWMRLAVLELANGARFGRQITTAACEVGRDTARRLGLPDGVQRGLYEVFEWWNGKGGAQGVKGESISLAGRIAQLAATAAHFDAIGGTELAVDAVRRQGGGVLDPHLADAFVDGSAEVLAQANADDSHAAVLDAEPRPTRSVSAGRLAEVGAAFADVADLKSPFLLGHSGGVASLAQQAAKALGLDKEAVEHLRVAALLHDLGRVGVSDSVWERRGPLTGPQWEQARLHAYHSERILARSAALRPMAQTAGMHHERLDGSGYHRGAKAREIPLPARVLAVADAFQAMTQERPHRPALSTDEAARRLQDAVRVGQLDGDAASAVLAQTGQRDLRIRAEAPAGLSDREIEVLRALARGHSNRQIAERFSISTRTAEHHVQHIYDKIGASSRAAAALFAMEHDLLE